jgi:hypothetical protein
MTQETTDLTRAPLDPLTAAYADGLAAGKINSTEENPYPENTEAAKYYEFGYLDGQRLCDDEGSTKPPAK